MAYGPSGMGLEGRQSVGSSASGVYALHQDQRSGAHCLSTNVSQINSLSAYGMIETTYSGNWDSIREEVGRIDHRFSGTEKYLILRKQKQPSRTVLVADSGYLITRNEFSQNLGYRTFVHSFQGNTVAGSLMLRHGDRANVLFGDGHVAGLDLGGLKETANKFEQVLNRNGVVVE